MRGKFVVIEGNQGLGKTTQTRLLIEYFNRHGMPYKSYFFPKYDSFFGKMTAAFLRGELGAVDQVSPYFTSLMFANDRLLVRDEILAALESGVFVLSDRWVSSNMAVQGAKIPDSQVRAEFLRWVQELEYEIYHQPKPDLTIYLRAAPELSLKNLREKQKEHHLNGKADIEESHEALIRNSFDLYEEMVQTLSNWTMLNLEQTPPESGLRSIDAIHHDILAILDGLGVVLS